MSRKVKVEFAPTFSIECCKENLKEGLMGIIEYHLHKDNSWVGLPFVSIKDKMEQLDKLKKEGYKYDKITYFKPLLDKLENPDRTPTQHLHNFLSWYQDNNVIV